MTNIFPYRRIVVIGTTSSTKSTPASQLAEKISGDFIELDALHWEPNWVEAGNYSVVRDVVWQRAVTIIWLDYPFHIAFWRLLTRNFRRSFFQEELWNSNRENFWTHLKLWSDESLFHRLLKTPQDVGPLLTINNYDNLLK